MQDLTITIVQCEQYWEDKKANFNKVSQLLDAAKLDTDLILLPEMFNTGFSMNQTLAEDENGSSIKFLKSIAAKYNCLLGASLIYKKGSSLTNRFVIVSSEKIVTYYDKRHLFSLAKEDHFFKPGINKSVLNIKGWKLNLQVCYDLRFPVFSRNLKEDPYDVLIYLANWPAKRQLAWDTLLKARSIENQCYTVGVNRVGKDGNSITYDGGSVFINALGETIERAEDKIESVFTQVLSYNAMNQVRTLIPFLNDGDQFQLNQSKPQFTN